MKIAIYNENCVRAGFEAHEPRGYSGNWPDDCGDVTVYEGTPQELYHLAAEMRFARPQTSHELFVNRVADTLVERGAHL